MRSISPLANIQFVQMAESQRVAQYISGDESDNDMELEPSGNSGNVQDRTKQNRRKWIPMCT